MGSIWCVCVLHVLVVFCHGTSSLYLKKDTYRGIPWFQQACHLKALSETVWTVLSITCLVLHLIYSWDMVSFNVFSSTTVYRPQRNMHRKQQQLVFGRLKAFRLCVKGTFLIVSRNRFQFEANMHGTTRRSHPHLSISWGDLCHNRGLQKSQSIW